MKFELNITGVNELRKSDEMQQILMNYANARTPDECESLVKVHKKRAVVYIHPTTAKAYKKNLQENTLLKAIKK